MEWQPIETCPKVNFDKEKWFMEGPIYLLFSDFVIVGRYGYTNGGVGRWRSWNGNIYPTHWMQLPGPPK